MENIVGMGKQAVSNFYYSFQDTANSMSLSRWVRIIAIVGAYLLLRPWILKLAAYGMDKDLAKETAPKEAAAKISPNSLRGGVDAPEDSEDEEQEGETTGADWGKKAKKRQRDVLKKILEAEELLRKEDDDDEMKKFLESDALVDYKVGEDGW
jgi:hypothetical protein